MEDKAQDLTIGRMLTEAEEKAKGFTLSPDDPECGMASWWSRSPHTGITALFHSVYTAGKAHLSTAYSPVGLAPGFVR